MNPVHDRGSMDPVHMKVVHMDPVQSGGTPIILLIIYNTELVQAESKRGEDKFPF